MAARRFQVSSRFPFEYHGWKNRGTTPIEDLSWQPYVPLESDGKVLLSKDSIMRIAMVNSREYQFAFENLYLSALSLTLTRFQFMIQGLQQLGCVLFAADGRWSCLEHADDHGRHHLLLAARLVTDRGQARSRASPNLNNQLQLTAANGFTLNLMSGGQLLVNLANSIVFEYSNKGVQVVTPNLTVSFVQPLLRGAWARNVTQGLSLQERDVLYNLRTFAEFRRQFYVSLVTGSGGFQPAGILRRPVISPCSTSFSSFATSEKNVKSARQNLTLLEAEFPRSKSALDVSQIAIQYQSSPGRAPVGAGELDDLARRVQDQSRAADRGRSADRRFAPGSIRAQRRAPGRDAHPHRGAVAAARARATSFLSPSWPTRPTSFRKCTTSSRRFTTRSSRESERWQKKLEATSKQGFEGPEGAHKKEIFDRERTLLGQAQADARRSQRRHRRGSRQRGDFPRQSLPNAHRSPRTRLRSSATWSAKNSARLFSAVSVTQTRIRVFLIELPPVDLTVNQAIQIALGNRLDLQNSLALVTDAWRNVEVDANQLRGFLNFVYNGNFAESPNHNGLVPLRRRQHHSNFRPSVRRADQSPGRAESVSSRPDPVPAGPPCLHAEPRPGRPADPPRHA